MRVMSGDVHHTECTVKGMRSLIRQTRRGSRGVPYLVKPAMVWMALTTRLRDFGYTSVAPERLAQRSTVPSRASLPNAG